MAPANAASRRTRVVDQVKLGLLPFLNVASLAHRSVGTQPEVAVAVDIVGRLKRPLRGVR